MFQKRVLLIAANGLGKTGVPNVIFQVAKVLSKQSSVDLVVFCDDDYYSESLRKIGVNIIKINLKKPTNRLLRGLWRLFVEKRITYSFFKNLFKTNKYDVIHSFKEYDSAYIFKCATKANIKKRIIHCNNEINIPKNFISRFLFNKKKRILYKYTTDFVGVSNRCCQVSYPTRKYRVIYNSFDEETYNINMQSNLKDNEFVLTQVATFSTRKNQLFSLKVIDLIRKNGVNAKLNIFGFEAEAGYLNKINSLIKELDLSDCVTVHDGRGSVKDILKKTTFFLLPSLSEAAPIVLVEAQACGIFCFVANNVTQDIDCGGICFLELDATTWSKAIIDKFKQNGNKRLAFNTKKFSFDQFEKNILGLYGW